LHFQSRIPLKQIVVVLTPFQISPQHSHYRESQPDDAERPAMKSLIAETLHANAFNTFLMKSAANFTVPFRRFPVMSKGFYV
jgi:hypothetical protein